MEVPDSLPENVEANKTADQPGKPKFELERKPGFPVRRIQADPPPPIFVQAVLSMAVPPKASRVIEETRIMQTRIAHSKKTAVFTLRVYYMGEL